jgi:metal-responsive CopG/Arc/MetJ family transcriptional regulator
MEQLSVMIPAVLMDKIERTMKRAGKTKSEVVRDLLHMGFMMQDTTPDNPIAVAIKEHERRHHSR